MALLSLSFPAFARSFAGPTPRRITRRSSYRQSLMNLWRAAVALYLLRHSPHWRLPNAIGIYGVIAYS